MGTKVELRLPVRLSAHQPYQSATVDVTFLLAAQQMIAPWPQDDSKFWDMVKQTKLDDILFPNHIDKEAPGSKSLTYDLQTLREKLWTLNRPRHNVRAVTNNDRGIDRCTDRYKPEKFKEYQDSVYQYLLYLIW